nr:Branched-chain amino acid transport system/permease component [uncultured organism]
MGRESAPAVGPAIALLVTVAVFGLTTNTFLDVDTLSLVVQQSLVIGTLALGQTLVVLTAGIDLANAAIMVFATLLTANLALTGTPGPLALLVGVLAAVVLGGVTGGLVTGLRLPPFIVTLGLLAIMTAISGIYAQGQGFPVTDEALGWLGTTKYLFGRVEVTYGMAVMLAMYLGVWFALSRTAWGRHVHAVGDAPEAARRSGISVRRTVLSAYLVAGLIYGVAAWQALGRVPTADENAFPLGNLDSIAAVVIGGASLFGGRGSVVGTLLGALVVAALRSGLSQVGLDSLYGDVAVGVLVIVAVAADRTTRETRR